MTEASEPVRPTAASGAEPPRQTDLDQLVRGLDDLADRPVGEHHDRLAEVHEALHGALHEPSPGS